MADYQEDKKRADAVNDFVVRNMTSDPQATANGINAITQSVTSPPNPQWGVGAGSDLKKVLRAASYIPRRTWGAARNIEQDIAAPAQFAAAAALNYLSGGEAQSLVDSTAKNLEERAKRYGIGVDSAPVKTVAAPVVKSEPAPLAAPPVKRPEFTSQEALNASVAAPAAGASGNRNDILYAAINRLDDKQFEKFMKDHPDIPGLSFIKGDDGRVVRSAENPDRKRNEPMTNAQLVATAAGLKAAGELQQGIGYREHAAAAAKIADLEKARMNDEKLLLDFQNNKLPAHSPVLAYGPDNKPIHATELGLLRMADDGKKIHPEYTDQVQSLLREREGAIKAEMDKDYAKNPSKEPMYDMSKMNDLNSSFAKKRWSLVKEWEAGKLQSLKKKIQIY